MYKPGDLCYAPKCPPDLPCREDGVPDHEHPRDARKPYTKAGQSNPMLHNVAYLPHSCQEWVIGGADEIKLMIIDLKKMLERIEKVR